MPASEQRPMPPLPPCPFCGMNADAEGDDTLYPTGRWREDDGLRHYLLPRDPREEHGRVWTMHCPTTAGGCGAEVSGDSRAEAIAAWNRRAQRDSEAREIPAELFDGYSVYSALTDGQKAFVSHEAVSAVLDAAVRVIRASHALKKLENTK